ncbi:hypothetical protein [Mesohalobacter halotolerans]|uniref:Viral A-type inclusion protein n=1 Tax=Mesohalobacter halotolerans TaxID=1883405 RepID=A0A4U5TTD8_9FLAO|nr:hypothetical protein [Mesohalobacter halotolerans]MBS3737823.1 hypothetical protein [Psychroflexus sp.]TKS57476.1 hypothetical protein FCN74_03405 [Mesohalobacter halotolerans]
MKTTHLLLIGLITVFASCSDTQPKEAKAFDQKMTKTIAIHDEVMPEMSKINQLISQLETKMDSTNIENYQPAIDNLKSGHDKMMSWMKSFGDEFSKSEINQGIQVKNVDSLKQHLKTLDKSFQEAKDMRDHIQEAIQEAEALIN